VYQHRDRTRTLKTELEMAKTLKTAAQLTAVCKQTGVEGIRPIADDRIDHNWTCKFLRRSGSAPSPDCQQMLATIVHVQQKYDLAAKSDLFVLMGDASTEAQVAEREWP
jgi:hypothetical protein